MKVTVTSVVPSLQAGSYGTGRVLQITLNVSDSVSVSGGVPKLILDDGGVAVYDPNLSTAMSLVFDYTVVLGQYSQNLAVTQIITNGASVVDNVGESADLSGAITSFSGLQIDGMTLTGPTGASAVPLAENNNGQILGYDATLKSQFVYDPSQKSYVLLPNIITGFASDGKASSLNDSGQLVGFVAPGISTPVVYDIHSNTYINLPLPAAGDELRPEGINDHGLVVGWTYNPVSGSQIGYVYDTISHAIESITTPYGSSNFYAINNNDQIFGLSGAQYFVLDLNTNTYIAVNPPPDASAPFGSNPYLGEPVGITDNGWVYGTYASQNGIQKTFLFNTGTGAYATYPLPEALPASAIGEAIKGIAANGQIVGDILSLPSGAVQYTHSGFVTAGLFTSNSEVVDFNNLSTNQQIAIVVGADPYHGLGGSDVVTLPNVAN
jgi:hypothetical protein